MYNNNNYQNHHQNVQKTEQSAQTPGSRQAATRPLSYILLKQIESGKDDNYNNVEISILLFDVVVSTVPISAVTGEEIK